MEKSKDALNKALELLSKRWTLRILWELNRETLNFRELSSVAGSVSTSVLSVRLAELRKARLVEHLDGRGYRLTCLGKQLMHAAAPIMEWAVEWHQTCSETASDS